MHPFAIILIGPFLEIFNSFNGKKYYILTKNAFLEIGISCTSLSYIFFISIQCMKSLYIAEGMTVDGHAMHPRGTSSWSVQLHNLNSMMACLYKPSNKHFNYFSQPVKHGCHKYHIDIYTRSKRNDFELLKKSKYDYLVSNVAKY